MCPQISELVVVTSLIDQGGLLFAKPDADDLADDDMVGRNDPGIADAAIEGNEARCQGGRTRLQPFPLTDCEALLPLKTGAAREDVSERQILSTQGIHAEHPVGQERLRRP